MKVINFLGGPSSGKSTIAFRLAGELKSRGVNCELVTEVAKDVTWEQNFHQLKNQFFIVAKQFDRIRRLEGKVDYIIMDTALIQNIPYFKDERYTKELSQIMINLHKSYDSINFFVQRREEYDLNGRKESQDESIVIDKHALEILTNEDIEFHSITSDIDIDELLEKIS